MLVRRTLSASTTAVLMIWIVGARARWREAISAYIWSMTPFNVVSRYSLYMLCCPLRLMYLIHAPKFLTVVGSSSWISLTDMIWPLAFFTFLSIDRKYQNCVPPMAAGGVATRTARGPPLSPC